MRYSDANEAMAGDVVQIGTRNHGVVIACMDRGEYLPDHDGWAYLKEGVMIDTDFAGLIHYTENVCTDELKLIHRQDSSRTP